MLVISQDGKKMCTQFQFQLVIINEWGDYADDWEIEGQNVGICYAIIDSNVDNVYAKYDTEIKAKDCLMDLENSYATGKRLYRFPNK